VCLSVVNDREREREGGPRFVIDQGNYDMDAHNFFRFSHQNFRDTLVLIIPTRGTRVGEGGRQTYERREGGERKREDELTEVCRSVRSCARMCAETTYVHNCEREGKEEGRRGWVRRRSLWAAWGGEGAAARTEPRKTVVKRKITLHALRGVTLIQMSWDYEGSS
jgi:hypothetical protein